MKAHLLHYETEDRKFYTIEVKENEHLITSGDYGTDGETTTKQYESPEAAQKEAHDTIKQLKEEGYIEMIEDSDVFRDNYFFAGKRIENIDWDVYLEEDTIININHALLFSEDGTINYQLGGLAELPYSDLVENLVIGEHFEEGFEAVVDRLIRSASSFSGLKHLFVGWLDESNGFLLSFSTEMDYSNFYKHYPQLESLVIRRGRELKLGKMDLPRLKHLSIESDILKLDVIKDICASDLPDLEHLELWLGEFNYGCDVEVSDLLAILDGKFPKLKYLGLKNYDKQDELIQHLQGASVLDNLHILDVSMSILTDAGAEALYNNDKLLNLEHIDCSGHFISEEWQEKLKAKFAKQNINVEHQKDSEDGKYYYVSAAE